MAKQSIIDKYYIKTDDNGGKGVNWRFVFSDIAKTIIIALAITIIRGGWKMYETIKEVKDLKAGIEKLEVRHEALINSTSQLARDISTIDGKLEIIIRQLK